MDEAPAMPEPPEVLSPAALEVWRRTAPILLERRTLTLADRDVLARYCTSQARWAEAEAEITKSGLTVTLPNGVVCATPYLKIARDAAQDALRAGGELGLSPSSRARVHASPEAGRARDKSRFFNKQA